MKVNQGLISRSVGGGGKAGVPLPAVAGPFVGLGYILTLPFIGVATLIWAGGHRAGQGLKAMWQRSAKAVAETEAEIEETSRAEAVSVNDLVRLLIEPLGCEFVVVDRQFRITHYYTPVSRKNELMERTAIGRHCFEVSHGRTSPCTSDECECPVSRVLRTKQEVEVTHRHERQLKGKSRQRLVRILALPIRDSHGNVTQVAELIWDAQPAR